MPSMPELLIILAIVVLLFGAKKGIKDFKQAVKEDDEKEEKKEIASKEGTSAETKIEEKKPEEKKSENA